MDELETFYSSVDANKVFNTFIRKIIFEDAIEYDEMLDTRIINCSKLSIIKYLILCIKEDIITKPKNEKYKDILFLSRIDDVTGYIAPTNSDGSLDIDGVHFDDSAQFLSLLRNKFAHGLFTYNEDCSVVTFYFDKQTVSIPIIKLCDLAVKVYSAEFEPKMIDKHDNPLFYVSYKNRKRNATFYADESGIRRMIDSTVSYLFHMKTNEEYILLNAYDCFGDAKRRINKEARNYSEDYPLMVKNVRKEIESCIDYFNKKSVKENWGVSLSYEDMVLTPEQKEDIYTKYKLNKGGAVQNIVVASEVPEIVARTLYPEYNRILVIHNCLELLFLLQYIQTNQITNMSLIGGAISENLNKPYTVSHDKLAATELLRLSNYGYLFERFDFDYSLLPLENVKPIVHKSYDKDINRLTTSLVCANNRLTAVDELIAHKTEQYNNVLTGSNINKVEILEKIKEELNNYKKTRAEVQSEYDDYTAQIAYLNEDRRNRTTYYRNKYIVERIRDAISHGNVQFIFDGKIVDTKIQFQDYDKGNLVFELIISLGDLMNLLDKCDEILINEKQKVRNK